MSGGRTFNSYYDDYQKGLNLTKDTWTFSLRLSQSYPGLGKIPAIAKEIAQMKTDIKKVYNDNKKRRFCALNNIRLIEIPYTEEHLIDYDYIMKKAGFVQYF